MKPLDTPNLPKGQVRTSLLQAGIYAEALRKHGTEPLSPAPEPGLSDEEREHADLICCHGGGRDIFVSSAQTALTEKLTAMGFNVRLCAAPEKDYPKNVGLNFAVGADFALGRFLYADRLLRAFLQDRGKALLDVKQGYAKCSLCFVTANAFITEDAGIADALRKTGHEALRIAPGDVYLSEAHHGFFGGAAGLIAPDTLAVTGSLRTHRDGDRIRDFLIKHNVRPLELTDGRITDIGGILPLTEE